MSRRRMDRAQRMRGQRMWWERNGAFFRGFLLGMIVAGIVAMVVVKVL